MMLWVLCSLYLSVFIYKLVTAWNLSYQCPRIRSVGGRITNENVDKTVLNVSPVTFHGLSSCPRLPNISFNKKHNLVYWCDGGQRRSSKERTRLEYFRRAPQLSNIIKSSSAKKYVLALFGCRRQELNPQLVSTVNWWVHHNKLGHHPC